MFHRGLYRTATAQFSGFRQFSLTNSYHLSMPRTYAPSASGPRNLRPAGEYINLIRLRDGEELEFVDWPHEPRHELLLENTWTRIYIANIPPGDSTMYHRHKEDTVYVILDDGGRATPGNQVVEGGVIQPPVALTLSRGGCLCWVFKGRTEEFIHRLQMPAGAKGAARIIGAEVRARPPFASTSPVSAPGYKLEEERDLMRVYRLELAPGESTGMHRWAFCAVIFIVDPGNVTVEVDSGSSALATAGPLNPGGYLWSGESVTQSITNGRDGAGFHAVIVEWKG